MKALMYGGGNIGRGFIGALFAQSGYSVTFVDIDKSLVDSLNRRGEYPLRFVSGTGYEDTVICGISAVNGNDSDAAAKAIADADIMAVSVGAAVLPRIVPIIAKGIRRRFAETDRPLDILICENLMDADKVLAEYICEYLTPEEQELFEKRIGLVETSIGRMVPVQTPSMKDGDPLRVCVETYGFLPADKKAFKGGVPPIPQLVPYEPFSFFMRRKLYIHNMGHCTCAYLGLYTGEEYISEAIDNPYIMLIVKGAMEESMAALAAEYGIAASELLSHIDDLLRRFANRSLGDTCRRVGQDTARKLSPSDRLIGAAHHCLEHGIQPACIAVGAAASVYRHLQEEGALQTDENARRVLREISKLDGEDELCGLITDMYALFREGTSPKQLRRAAEQCKSTVPVV